MWSSRLFGKLFLVYVVLNAALAVAFLVIVSNWQRQQLVEHLKQRLYDTAVVLRSEVEPQLEVLSAPETDETARQKTREELQALLLKLAAETDTRMTLVAPQGEVIADSEADPARMDNHGRRPEILAALQTGIGTAERRSDTVGHPMLYLALPVKHGDSSSIVRVAVDVASIDQQVASMQWFLWGLAGAAMFVALGLTYVGMVRLLRPLRDLTRVAQNVAAGGSSRAVPIRSHDEVGQLSSAFAEMQQEVSRRIEQLEESNSRMVTVMTSMDEGIIAVDARERILLANDASRKLLEFAAADAVGRPLLEVTRSRPVYEAVAESLRTGKAAHREFETTGSRRRALSLRAACLPGTPPSGVVVVLRDVSELRRLENLRRELVANVSHELKTPLASIKAYAETLRLGAVHDAEHNMTFVTRIEDQAERLNQLIIDLLQIARVESGQEAFDIVDVPLETAIEACLGTYADVAAAKQIKLAARPPGESIHVRADEEGLATILNNLVDNAIKYTPAEGHVTVSWSANNGTAVIDVSDSGIGISSDDQPRVFERFYRVDKARSRELGGTGLGLSIVKHLAQAFGGTVAIESEVGRGATFRVRLPAG